MARFDKMEVIAAMSRTRIVPVFYNSDIETACNILKACHEGGIRVFEFTNRGEGAHEVFCQLKKFADRECPDMIIGAGTVVDTPTAALYIQLGANFIVGPLFNADVAKVCNRRMVPYIPGCGTATEIGMAQEAGCDVCKVFPAGELGGASFVKSLLAPMPWSKIMATGGVEPTEESISAWMRSGVMCVGMGSNLFPKELVAGKKWGEISRICRRSVELAEEYSLK